MAIHADSTLRFPELNVSKGNTFKITINCVPEEAAGMVLRVQYKGSAKQTDHEMKRVDGSTWAVKIPGTTFDATGVAQFSVTYTDNAGGVYGLGKGLAIVQDLGGSGDIPLEAVLSVNGIRPDSLGNVILTGEDIPYSKAEGTTSVYGRCQNFLQRINTADDNIRANAERIEFVHGEVGGAQEMADLAYKKSEAAYDAASKVYDIATKADEKAEQAKTTAAQAKSIAQEAKDAIDGAAADVEAAAAAADAAAKAIGGHIDNKDNPHEVSWAQLKDKPVIPVGTITGVTLNGVVQTITEEGHIVADTHDIIRLTATGETLYSDGATGTAAFLNAAETTASPANIYDKGVTKHLTIIFEDAKRNRFDLLNLADATEVVLGAWHEGAFRVFTIKGDGAVQETTGDAAYDKYRIDVSGGGGGGDVTPAAVAAALNSAEAVVGTDTVSIGSDAGTSIDAVIIGAGTSATSSGVAVGRGAKAGNTNSNDVAIGRDSEGRGGYTVAIGANAFAEAGSTIAIGGGGTNTRVHARGSNAVAIGSRANSLNSNTIAIGQNANAGGANAVAIGSGTKASQTVAITIGQDSDNDSSCGVAIGQKTMARGDAAIVIGRQAVAGTVGVSGAIAIGDAAKAGTVADMASLNSIAIGAGADARYGSAVVIGDCSNGKALPAGLGAVCIGTGGSSDYAAVTDTTGEQSIGINSFPVGGARSIAIGTTSSAPVSCGSDNIFIGQVETTQYSEDWGATWKTGNYKGSNDIVIGTGAKCDGDPDREVTEGGCVVIGKGASGTGTRNVAIGYNASAGVISEYGAKYIGRDNIAIGTNAVAGCVGSQTPSTAYTCRNTAIGHGACAGAQRQDGGETFAAYSETVICAGDVATQYVQETQAKVLSWTCHVSNPDGTTAYHNEGIYDAIPYVKVSQDVVVEGDNKRVTPSVCFGFYSANYSSHVEVGIPVDDFMSAILKMSDKAKVRTGYYNRRD